MEEEIKVANKKAQRLSSKEQRELLNALRQYMEDKDDNWTEIEEAVLKAETAWVNHYEKKLSQERQRLITELEERVEELVTEPEPLDFDKKPLDDKDPYSQHAYCGGCKSFVLEGGCTCGTIEIDDIKQILTNLREEKE